MSVLVYEHAGYRQEYPELTDAEVTRILANQASFLRNAAEVFGRVGLPEVWRLV